MIFLKFAGIQRGFLHIVIDIDECNASARVCDVNAHCQNTLGSHVCSCKYGFTGDGKNCTGEDRVNVLGEKYMYYREQGIEIILACVLLFSFSFTFLGIN